MARDLGDAAGQTYPPIEWPVTETRYFARLRVSFNRLQMAPRPFPFVPILPNFP